MPDRGIWATHGVDIASHMGVGLGDFVPKSHFSSPRESALLTIGALWRGVHVQVTYNDSRLDPPEDERSMNRDFVSTGIDVKLDG